MLVLPPLIISFKNVIRINLYVYIITCRFCVRFKVHSFMLILTDTLIISK